MSAAEKLKALDEAISEGRFAQITLEGALPQIRAVVEAAERVELSIVADPGSNRLLSDLHAALADLDKALE